MSGDETRMPKPFTIASTDTVPIADRVDYWQELFVSCEVAKPAGLADPIFRGQLARHTGSDGTSFARIDGSPLVCRFGRRETGRKILGTVLKGKLRIQHDGGETTTLDRSSGLVLLDADRRVSTESTDYAFAQMFLPETVVGGMRRRRDADLVRLPRDGLAPLLEAHLLALAAHGEALDDADAATAMRITTSLAVACLSRAFSRTETVDETFDDVLFAAACRYMEAHASRASLTANCVARAIGCSRARLYRIFLDRDRTVGESLRDIRLTRARLRLAAEPDRSISAIAFDSGYSDLSGFGKAFRRRFGTSPMRFRSNAAPVVP